MKSETMIYVGAAINFAFSLIVMVRTYFAILYMVDQDMGAMESIQASMKASGPLWAKTIGLAIVSGVVAGLGVLALVVGLLISIPVSYMMWVSAYRQIEGREDAHPEGQPVASY